jgi:hypothetical protein
VALAVIGVSIMSTSVIDNDKEQLNANRIPGRSRMTSNSRAIRAREDAKGLTPVERIGSDALTTNLRASTDCTRIDIVLDPVHFCSYETKPPAKALKPTLEFACASEDPRETPNDG